MKIGFEEGENYHISDDAKVKVTSYVDGKTKVTHVKTKNNNLANYRRQNGQIINKVTGEIIEYEVPKFKTDKNIKRAIKETVKPLLENNFRGGSNELFYMNELERIISKYLSKDGTGITYSNFNQEEVNKLFQNMQPYERPDILSIYDNKIVAIEHFEFDSYKNNKKGSNYKFQENIIEQKMQKVEESEFMSFNPQTTGFALLIPKEEMEGDINE